MRGEALRGFGQAEVYLFGDAQQAILLAEEAIDLIAKQLGSTEE